MSSEPGPKDLPLGRRRSEGAASGLTAGLAAAGSLWRLLARALDRRRQRLHLGELDDHLLKDIGVSRREARREASRWFFD